MFERFDEGARQVVVQAQEEARRLRHNYIGTEHMLLGLTRDEGTAGAALGRLGIQADDVRTQVSRIIGSGDDEPRGQIPFTPRSKKVLELSLREALSLGSSDISPEHVLLGLVRENGGVAAQILYDHGVTARRVAEEMATSLPDASESPTAYAAAFSDAAPKARGVSDRGPRYVARLDPFAGRSAPLSLIAGFGLALAIGILIGWLIWG